MTAMLAIVGGMCQKAPSTRGCIKTGMVGSGSNEISTGQKAPSTRRCIKTLLGCFGHGKLLRVRKHPAPEGALRQETTIVTVQGDVLSESTQHQKVH